MKIDVSFLKWVAVWYGAALALGFAVLSATDSQIYSRSLLGGSAMSLANFLLGFLSVEFAFDKSHTTFLKIVLGGMALRLFLMALTVLVLIKGYDVDALSLMLTLLGFYALNLTLEIVFLQKKVALKNSAFSS